MKENNHVDQQKDYFGCMLYIDTEGDSPEVITFYTDVIASELIVKGSPLTRGKEKKIVDNRFNEYNLWIYKTDKIYAEPGVYLNSSIEKLVAILDGKKDAFLDVFGRYQKKHILCYAYFYEVNPYFKLDKALVKKLACYNIDLEFDLYCLGD